MRSNTPIAIVVVGLVLVAVGILVQQVMPVLGRVAYQAAAAGSYTPSDYRVGLVAYYAIAAIVLALGVGAYLQERKAR